MIDALNSIPSGITMWTKKGTSMKSYYACPKCENTEYFRITMHNNWAVPVGSPMFFDDPQQHVASKDYILTCLVCQYTTTVRVDCKNVWKGEMNIDY